MKKLLVVIDMQNDFITGALGTKEAVSIVPAVKAKIESYQANGDCVVFTKDTHFPNYLETQEGQNLPVVHCIDNSFGWQLSDELLPYENETICFHKPSFGSLELAQYVADHSFESVELIGLCTDICVISNAMLLKAYVPEIPISVDSSCCAGVTPQSHANALEAMKMCHIQIN